MLEKLLTEIHSGGTFETRILAGKLETTPELVQAMLEHLQRTGHIRSYQTSSKSCNGCGLKRECKVACQTGGVRLWQS